MSFDGDNGLGKLCRTTSADAAARLRMSVGGHLLELLTALESLVVRAILSALRRRYLRTHDIMQNQLDIQVDKGRNWSS